MAERSAIRMAESKGGWRPLLAALVVLLLLIGATGPIVLGFFGHLHPAIDAFSHLRAHLAAGLIGLSLVLLAFTPFRREALVALAFGVGALATTAGSMVLPHIVPAAERDGTAPEDAAVYRLLHLNLRFDNPEPEKALSLIGRKAPDVITLTEVSDEWKPRIALLAQSYPHQRVCEVERHIGGVAILSRRPFAAGGEPRCIFDGELARATVLFGGRPVEIGAMHLGWPWPMGHHWQIGQLADDFAGFGEAAILAGDFNAVGWSDAVRRVGALSGLTLVPRVGPTWLHRDLPDILRRYVGLPIDHVMTGERIVLRSAGTIEDAGSDHLPVLIEFSLPPPVLPETVLQAAAPAYRPAPPALPRH